MKYSSTSAIGLATDTTLLASLQKLAHKGLFIGVVLGALLFAPATWVAMGIAHLSKGAFELAEVQGSVWQGSGKLVIRGDSGRNSASKTNTTSPVSPNPNTGLMIASPFAWKITPQLFSPRSWGLGVSVSVRNACCIKDAWVFNLRPVWADRLSLVLQLSDVNSEWPAEWLSALGAPWNTVAPKGLLSIQSTGVQWVILPLAHSQMQGMLELTLRNLSSQLSTLEPLGTYAVKLTGQGDAGTINHPRTSGISLHLSLQTIEGRLELRGEGDWSNSKLRFNGLATAQSGFEQALANLLGVLGPRRDNTATLKIGT